MPNYLQDLKVRKVSFVGSPANQRRFLLLKSTDGENERDQPTPTIPTTNKKEEKVGSTTGNVPTLEEFSELKKQHGEVLADLIKIKGERDKELLMAEIRKNCAYYPGSADDLANDILKLRVVDKDAADRLFKAAEATSKSLEQATIFQEQGSSVSLENETAGGDFLHKVAADVSNVKKSDTGGSVLPQQIIDIVRKQGPLAYQTYRRDHLVRSMTQVPLNL